MPSILNATTTSGLVTSADNSGSLQLQTNNGTTAVTIDTSQNVGVGSASSGNKFEVAGSGMFSGAVTTNTTGTHISYQSSNSQIGAWGPDTSTNGTLVFFSARSNGVNGLERMRIDSSGRLLVGCTNEPNASINGFKADVAYTIIASSGQIPFYVNRNTNTGEIQQLRYNNGAVGNISTNGSNCTFNSTSDYRLKENIAPMTGALATVAALKPCTYTWKVDGSAGQGFIAHELQEVVPDAVTGEKDAVEEDGSIKSQQIDTSFLVATLTAAIQELNAKVEAQAAEIAALKGA